MGEVWESHVQEAGHTPNLGRYGEGGDDGVGFRTSELHPLVFGCQGKRITVVVHMDDVCGEEEGLEWLFDELNQKYYLKRHTLEPTSQGDVKHWNRVLRRGAQGVGGMGV